MDTHLGEIHPSAVTAQSLCVVEIPPELSKQDVNGVQGLRRISSLHWRAFHPRKPSAVLMLTACKTSTRTALARYIMEWEGPQRDKFETSTQELCAGQCNKVCWVSLLLFWRRRSSPHKLCPKLLGVPSTIALGLNLSKQLSALLSISTMYGHLHSTKIPVPAFTRSRIKPGTGALGKQSLLGAAQEY